MPSDCPSDQRRNAEYTIHSVQLPEGALATSNGSEAALKISRAYERSPRTGLGTFSAVYQLLEWPAVEGQDGRPTGRCRRAGGFGLATTVREAALLRGLQHTR